MFLKKLLGFILLFLPILSQSQKLSFYDDTHFLLEGTLIADTLKEHKYDRLPKSYKSLVREPVWNLSKSSAGLSIRFKSNSSSIGVKWSLLHNNSMNHMAETGIKGIDLYFNNNGKWQYLNTARPTGKENSATLISNMPKEMREYKMYLPLYDGVENLEVGIDSTSTLQKPEFTKQESIVFYGTSITQGGCASRPGMAHTNIISRKLDVNCINLGFSGNGKMEKPIVELISNFDPLFYVIECLPNMNPDEVTENTLPLVEGIREKKPNTPIIFVENFIYTKTILDKSLNDLIKEKNLALKNQYDKMLGQGFKNIYYIKSNDALGTDNEGTVDGVHFTDLGFIRYANFLIKKFEEFRLIKSKN